MKAVKFLMSHTVGTLYAKGEKASFEDAVADDLVERKIASPVKMEKSTANAAAAKKVDDDKADAAKKVDDDKADADKKAAKEVPEDPK